MWPSKRFQDFQTSLFGNSGVVGGDRQTDGQTDRQTQRLVEAPSRSLKTISTNIKESDLWAESTSLRHTIQSVQRSGFNSFQIETDNSNVTSFELIRFD